MIDFSESKIKEKKIGDPFNCKFTNMPIREYLSSLNGEYHISQLKFFFTRKNPHLIAIQFLFQKKENFGSKDPSSFISFTERNNNKYIGALPNYDPLNKNTIENIEEFILQLSFGEEIIIFSGHFKNDLFLQINIKTNFGKFFEIGNKKLKENFTFEYLNERSSFFFDGLTVGADENKIKYLKEIIYEDKKKYEKYKEERENRHKKELLDISEDFIVSTKAEPIYKTNIFGAINNKTIIIDDMEKSGLIIDIKEGRAALTEMRIFSNGKKITRIDNQYTYYNNNEKNILISHQAYSYANTDSNYCFILTKDDYIKDAIIYLSSRKKNVKGIELTTSKGVKFKTNNTKGRFSKELRETKGKKLRILGMCIGSEKYIQFVQFYYESKNTDIN